MKRLIMDIQSWSLQLINANTKFYRCAFRNRNAIEHHTTASPGSTTATSASSAGAASTSTGVMNQNELTSQKYTPVLKKFFGASNWPRQNVILPGNEVLFSLETASDYVKDDKVSF